MKGAPFILKRSQVRTAIEGTHHAGRVGNEIPTAGRQVEESHEFLRDLVVEADSYITHMVHRGSWPEDRYALDRLISRLRKAGEA